MIVPATEVGISGFVGLAERKKALWLKERVFSRKSTLCVNMFFASEVYESYVSLCDKTQRKPKNEHYIMKKMAELMSIFRIFLMNGRRLGRGRSFVYNEKKVVLSVALEEHQGLAQKRFRIMDVTSEDVIMSDTVM